MAIFQILKDKKVKRIRVNSERLERDVQKLFENNLEEILNIIFLASEYSTTWGGRIDTLGIDKNGSGFKISANCSSNFTKYNSSVKREEFKEMTSQSHARTQFASLHCFFISCHTFHLR